MNWVEITSIVFPAFAIFFVVIDPIGIVPFFMTLTDDKSKKEKSKIAFRSVFIATIILTIFAVAGEGLLTILGISLSAFKIAGGLLLFLIAVNMLFEKRTERRRKNTEKVSLSDDSDITHNEKDHDVSEDVNDIAVFPLAVPFLAGPGSIAAIMLLISKYEGQIENQIIVYLVMLTTLFTCFVMFRFTNRFEKIVTPKITNVATRLLGMLLAALSVEFVLSGLKSSVLFL